MVREKAKKSGEGGELLEIVSLVAEICIFQW